MRRLFYEFENWEIICITNLTYHWLLIFVQDLRSELEGNQSAVTSLRETADQLLMSNDMPQMSAARDKTHTISNRLRSLLHLTNSYIESLETKLGMKVKMAAFSPFRKLNLQ